MPIITKENSRAMQLKSAKKRKENNERKAIIRDWLYSELSKPASSSSDDPLGLYFVKKALQGIVATVTLEDMERIQRILGESSLNIKLENTDPAENLAALINESRANS